MIELEAKLRNDEYYDGRRANDSEHLRSVRSSKDYWQKIEENKSKH